MTIRHHQPLVVVRPDLDSTGLIHQQMEEDVIRRGGRTTEVGLLRLLAVPRCPPAGMQRHGGPAIIGPKPRRHRLPQQPGVESPPARHGAVEDAQAGGVGGRVPQGAGTLAEADRRQPRRHRIPQQPGVESEASSPTCCRTRASWRRRSPSSARRWPYPEASRRQPRRFRLPRWPGLGLFEGDCPPGVVWAGQGAFLHL